MDHERIAIASREVRHPAGFGVALVREEDREVVPGDCTEGDAPGHGCRG
jgi:hypothetical protein